MVKAVTFLSRRSIRSRDQMLIGKKLTELNRLAASVHVMLRSRARGGSAPIRQNQNRAYELIGWANALILELRLLSLNTDERAQVESARAFWRSALEMVRHGHRQFAVSGREEVDVSQKQTTESPAADRAYRQADTSRPDTRRFQREAASVTMNKWARRSLGQENDTAA